jgi:hypothetical protein
VTRSFLRAVALVLLFALAPGCVTTQYGASVVARGELTVTYRHGMRLSMSGTEVAHAPTFASLPDVVSCVPDARAHALAARSSGRRARIFSIVGATLGLGAFMAFAALGDRDHAVGWALGGLGSGLMGLGFAIAGRREKGDAVGHALDAVNFYNDGVGSLGATCRDLTYPAPAGPIPEGAIQMPGEASPQAPVVVPATGAEDTTIPPPPTIVLPEQ